MRRKQTCYKCRRNLPRGVFLIATRQGWKPGPTCPTCRAKTQPALAARMAGAQNARAKTLGVAGRITSREVQAIFEAANGRCAYCEYIVGLDRLTLDHKIPLHKGGENAVSNIVAACWQCNKRKGKQEVSAFMALEQFNVRLDKRTLDLIVQLTRNLGVSQADVIRLAVRLLERKDRRDRVAAKAAMPS